MALSDIEKLLFIPQHRVPFPSCSPTGWYSPVYLFTALDAIYLPCRHPSMQFICLPVNIPWDHSSVNLTICLHYISGYFSPVCLDTCQGVTHLSNYGIYLYPRCHALPRFESCKQLFLSGGVKILSLTLRIGGPNPSPRS